MEDQDKQFLEQAVSLAGASIDEGGGPFGAIIVKDNELVASGTNMVVKTHDPTAHAEIVAICTACKKLETYELKGCMIYSSCEPCPMCLGAIYWAHIDKVVFASSRSDAAQIGFDDEFIYKELCLAPNERSIIMEQLVVPEANKVFRRWQKKSDKIMY